MRGAHTHTHIRMRVCEVHTRIHTHDSNYYTTKCSQNGTLREAPALLDASNVLGVSKSLLSGPSWVESFRWEVLCPVLGEES